MAKTTMFRVEVKLEGQSQTDLYEVAADDAACALGTALDELSDEVGKPLAVEWVMVVTDPQLPGRKPLDLDDIPAQVQAAIERGVADARQLV